MRNSLQFSKPISRVFVPNEPTILSALIELCTSSTLRRYSGAMGKPEVDLRIVTKKPPCNARIDRERFYFSVYFQSTRCIESLIRRLIQDMVLQGESVLADASGKPTASGSMGVDRILDD